MMRLARVVYFIAFVGLLLPFFNAAEAQTRTFTTDNKKAIQAYEKGLENLNTRQYKKAIADFEQAIKKDEKFAEAYVKLGHAYRNIGEKEQARKALSKGFELGASGEAFSTENFFYAEYLVATGDYEKALQHVKAFTEAKRPNRTLLKQAEKLQADIAYAAEAMKNPVNFKPQRLPETFNQFHHHYFPAITADGQMFIYTARLGQDPIQDEDIYVLKKGEVGWSAPKPISPLVNSRGNEGAASISGDGKTLVFTACERPDSYGGCDLFISTREGEKWSAPKNLGRQVNSTSWDSQPSLSADGRTIYFASERPGGLGKSDIWMTKQNEKGEWQRPVNLGNKINTPERESAPNLHASGSTLYFASEGHPGLGGVDLYKSDMTDSSWAQPVNLGYPLNTSRNESTIFIDAANSKGYFSKDASETRIFRIELYEFDVPEQWKSKVKAIFSKGKVYDAKTKQPLGATIDLFDLVEGDLESKVSSDRETGEYIVVLNEGKQYGMYATSPGYMPRSLSFDYSSKQDFNPKTLDIYLNPIEKGAAIVLQNLFFATGEFKLEDKSKTELAQVVQFLKNNPEVRIEIAGYTDDVGSDAANKVLSDNRAKAVQQYLVKEGIEKGRISAKGYGENSPAVPNTSDENRAQNRRIEMQIL